MPRVCRFTGARTRTGRRIKYRGKPKYQGGIGLKPTAITKRKFKPNLQTVRAVIDGSPQRVKASTRAIRQGLVVKPLKRKYGYTRQQKQEQAG
jgi:large subunit ribosomal protein L28